MISHDHTPPSHHVCGFACCCLGLGLSWRSRCSAHCVCRSRFFRRSSSFAPQFNASKVPPMPRMGVDSMRVVSACLFSMPVFPNSIIWTQASNKAGGGSYRVLDGTSDICHRDCCHRLGCGRHGAGLLMGASTPRAHGMVYHADFYYSRRFGDTRLSIAAERPHFRLCRRMLMLRPSVVERSTLRLHKTCYWGVF